MRHPPVTGEPRDAQVRRAAVPRPPPASSANWVAVAELDFRAPVCASLGAIDVVELLQVDGARAYPTSARGGARVALRLPLQASSAEDAAHAAVAAVSAAVEQLAQPVLWMPGSLVVRAVEP